MIIIILIFINFIKHLIYNIQWLKYNYLTHVMKLVDMQDLKFCPEKGPGSSPGVGIFIISIFLKITTYFEFLK